MTERFPDGFLWGTATAAHQVEGNNVNSDLWVLENLANTVFAEPSGDAIDHYHRYPDDIALLAKLGFNSYRFSVEWARVEPEPGHFSQAALDHYRRMLETCHRHGLQPVVTYHHFTSPRWLISHGGWRSPDTAGRFADYCARVTSGLGDLMTAACTINEVNIPLMIGQWLKQAPDNPEQITFRQQAAQAFAVDRDEVAPFLFAISTRERDIILAAHAQSAAAIKAERSDLPVGMTVALGDMQAVAGGEALRDQARRGLQDVFLEAARGDDFIGVQTYTRERYGPQGPLPPEAGVPVTQMGYEVWPEALEMTIRRAVEVTGLPVYVTENGIGTEDDAQRLDYYRRALSGVRRCLSDGIDIRGYFAWSAFDNYEWMRGFGPKFGIIEVDRSTQTRTVKPSARWLGEVAKANCLDI